jgi:hypothetical protein
MDPRIRIHPKMTWIRNTGLNDDMEKCHKAWVNLDATLQHYDQQLAATIGIVLGPEWFFFFAVRIRN